jgi:hypothetical protein
MIGQSVGLDTMVNVFAEDMRYAKSTVLLDSKGKPIYGEDGNPKEVLKAPIVYQVRHKNTIVDDGRKEVLKDLFGFGVVASFLAGSVGDGATFPTDNTRDRLVNELLGNAARRSVTDTSGAALDATDIVAEVSGSNFWKIIAQFVFLTSDLNNGSTFAEYGLHSTTTNPGSPTGLSGVMLARYVPASSFVKSVAFQVTVQWSLRS